MEREHDRPVGPDLRVEHLVVQQRDRRGRDEHVGGWAYGAIYRDSRERTAALDGWLWTYNHRRRHSAIGRQPPITRLNNLLGSYS